MIFFKGEIDPQFKVFHELMAWKVKRILVVSRPYDAWIMEKDQPLAERIIHEYRGLNLSHPPRLNWVSSAKDALEELDKQEFDIVITMPGLPDMDPYALGLEIKAKNPGLPVILLSHSPVPPPECSRAEVSGGIDRTFVWAGNPDVLLTIIKSTEDLRNVEKDTTIAGIRVILFVEDSSAYMSSLLPTLYREVVLQTQHVIEHSQSEERRLLAMRARPKILSAGSYEEAFDLYRRYEPQVLGVISDVSFPRCCRPDSGAGIDLLNRIHHERFDIPLLLMSNEPGNAEKAAEIPAQFVDKNSAELQSEVRLFLKTRLGFGDFVFVTPGGEEVDRATNLGTFERALATIPAECFRYHCRRNDFSRWLFARAEIRLASYVRDLNDDDFQSIEGHRQYLLGVLQEARRSRHKGVIVTFNPEEFDSFTEFAKIGKGSMGGKARGLAFLSSLLHHTPYLHRKFPEVEIGVPQTLVVTTEGFDEFVDSNDLRHLARTDIPDDEVAARFMAAAMPDWIVALLEAYLEQVKYPIAVRSSSLLEDARFRAYAGLYRTYLLPNINEDLESRRESLLSAVKLIYASTYFKAPKDFSIRVGNRVEEEKMAVIVQKVCGSNYDGYFYPAVSGVAQSYNYYPFAGMKSEDGVAVIALGLGKTVMEGGKALRFSPKHPELASQVSRLDDFLKGAQREFLSLPLNEEGPAVGVEETTTLARRNVYDTRDEYPVRLLTSTYVHEENRLSEGPVAGGYPVVTCAQVLKYGLLPLGEIIGDLLAIGLEGMGCPVEIEFAVNITPGSKAPAEFCVLQIRHMAAREETQDVDIPPEEVSQSFLVSHTALGNGVNQTMCDIVFVDAEGFEREATPQIAQEIGKINRSLIQDGRKYLLIGPGRWGSADRWLGIPVQWQDISGVGAIVETELQELRTEPSQGSHFFHNVVTLGITYIAVRSGKGEYIDWEFLRALPQVARTRYVHHVRLDRPMVLKVDGKTGRCVIKIEHT